MVGGKRVCDVEGRRRGRVVHVIVPQEFSKKESVRIIALYTDEYKFSIGGAELDLIFAERLHSRGCADILDKFLSK